MTRDELIADKSFTRKVLAQMVMEESAKLVTARAVPVSIAAKLSEAIDDHAPRMLYAGSTVYRKDYTTSEGIERVKALVEEARKVPNLEHMLGNLREEVGRLERHLETTIEERTRAQEAVALVGATFNDYRTADRVDLAVSEYERVGDVEYHCGGQQIGKSRLSHGDTF